MPTSRDEPNLIEDLMAMGGNLLGAAFGARHEWGAQARERMESCARRLNIVSRDEFEVARMMIVKARDMQEDLNARMSVVESRLGIAPKSRNEAQAGRGKQKTNKKTAHSPSVKKSKRASEKS